MSQIHNNHTGTKEITCVLSKRLPSHSTDSNHDEVFWEVSHAKNQNQFAYRPNRSTDDAISSTLHLALTHLENKDSYVRMLFIDFSSAFNTIIPQQLINKLNLLGLNNSLCNWILDFLTGRPQSVRVGHNTSSTTTLSTGAPQGCVFSPLLFTLLTHDCIAKFSSNHIIKFADDTTVVGLISNNEETHYREEVAQLAEWCGANNLSLNVEKSKEVVLDFRRRNSIDHPPLTIDSSNVERVSSTKFLGVHITPGPPTPCHSPRRHNSACTFSAGWKEQVSHHPSSPHSTGAPLRVCWPAASLSGTGTAVLLTARPSSGQWTRLQRSSVPLSHPSWTISLHDAPAKPTASWRTPPTPPTVSSSSYHQEDGTGASEPAPPDCSTAFSPRQWEPWTQITPPSSETPCKPLPPETWTIPPLSKHPPTLPHQRKNCVNFFVQFKCATHNPAKDSKAIYVCLHAHALQIILYCSPASCLTHNVSLCTCTVFMWSIRIVCIVCIFCLLSLVV